MVPDHGELKRHSGKRRFDIEGPRLWYSLPEDLRRVKKMKDFGKALKNKLLKNILRFYNLLLY